jgi:heat shock protein HtpX
MPDLHWMAAELAERAGIPKPRLYLVEDHQPNAFATGRNPEKGVVAVTTGLLQRMPSRELRGILAHEISHIRNRDTLIGTIAASVAGAISYAAHALSFAAFFGSHSSDEEGSSGGILALLVAPFAGFLLQMAISRSREYLADESAARLTGDPGALADGLRRLERDAKQVPPHQLEPATASLYIVNPFAGTESIASLFSTHPPTSKRIARLQAMLTTNNTPRRAA